MKNGNPKSADFFLLNILWKNKFFLLTVTVVCTVGAWFISRSSLFQPRYECTAYVCAENSTPMPQMLFNTEDVRFELILKYGTIEPRMLDHFTMLTSYNFNSRVQCHEQRGGNTLISASDENPQKAFQMVETIIEVIQQKGHQSHHTAQSGDTTCQAQLGKNHFLRRRALLRILRHQHHPD